MIHVAPLHDEHHEIEITAPPLKMGTPLKPETVYLAVSEKPGEDNSGYLVAELADDAVADWWCACDDFRFKRIENGRVVGDCKHVTEVKLRTRQDVEPDQATLGGGPA